MLVLNLSLMILVCIYTLIEKKKGVLGNGSQDLLCLEIFAFDQTNNAM